MNGQMKSGAEKGFGLVVVLAAVVIVAIIGTAGWLVYNHNHSNSRHSSTTTGTTDTQTSQQTTNPTTSPPAASPIPTTGNATDRPGIMTPIVVSSTSTSFVAAFPELRIKLNLPSSLSDIEYSVEHDPSGDIYAHLSSKSLIQAAANSTSSTASYCDVSNNGLGFLARTAPKTLTSQIPPTASKVIGSYGYYYQNPQQGCSPDSATVSLEISLMKSLAAAFSSVALQ